MAGTLTVTASYVDSAGNTTTATATSQVPGSATLTTSVGASMIKLTGESTQQASVRYQGIYGDASHKFTPRVFLTSAPSSSSWGSAVPNDRPVVVSFKADAASIVAGTLDAQLLGFWNASPTDKPIYWSYWHEPENDYTTAAAKALYIAAWQHLVDLQFTVNRTNLYATLILQDWTLDVDSHRNWRDWYPGAEYLRVLAWDQYAYSNNNGGLITEATKQLPGNCPSASISHGEGLFYAVGEFGCKFEETPVIPDSARATWLTQTGATMKSNGAAFITLFNSNVGGTFNINDHPSLVTAWRSVVTS
jgi:hypothetical protein